MNEPTLFDAFSGIGGFALAGERAGFKITGFSEIDPYASLILKKHWPTVRNFGCIKSIDMGELGEISVITAGDPCQPHSIAGSKLGISDARFLWPYAYNLIKAKRPRFFLNENVPGSLYTGALDRKINDLEAIGYSCGSFLIPAFAIGAPYKRERIYLVASDSHRNGKLQSKGSVENIGQRTFYNSRWPTKDELTESIDGVPKGLDELRCLGNSVVPQVAEIFLKEIRNHL